MVMPISNPYPERAIASFLLVGAMGVALLFIGSPAENRSAETPVIAQEDPEEPVPRGTTPQDRRPQPAAAPTASAADLGPVFSEAVARRRAETRTVPTSAAPEPTQEAPDPDPAEPTPAPEPDPGLLTCATPVVFLNDLLCR